MILSAVTAGYIAVMSIECTTAVVKTCMTLSTHLLKPGFTWVMQDLSTVVSASS